MAFLNDSDEKGGAGDNALEFDAGYIVNGAVGLDADMYRVEGAVGYQHNGVAKYDGDPPMSDDEKISILSFMANGYVDIPMNGAGVEPYVMAGIGVASVGADNGIVEDSDTVLAYQFGAGVAIDASPNIAVDLGYRYFMASDATFDDIDPNVDYTISSHNILAGVRVGL